MDTTPSRNPTEGCRPASHIRILTAVAGVAATAGKGFVVDSGGIPQLDTTAVTWAPAATTAGMAAPDLPSSDQAPSPVQSPVDQGPGRRGKPPAPVGAPGGQPPTGAVGTGHASTGGS
jgi:hypothetical protein